MSQLLKATSVGAALADPMPCHIGPYTPWALAVPVYENDTIVEQPADLTTLADRYAAFAARFSS